MKQTEVKQNKKGTEKKKFKLPSLPSSLAIIIGVVFFVTILTLIVPHDNYITWQYELFNKGVNALGIDGTSFDTATGIFTYTGPDNINEVAQSIMDSYGIEGTFDGTTFVASQSLNFLQGSTNEFGQYGIFDAVRIMFAGYFQVIDLGLYLVCIFAVVELLMQTGSLRNGVSSLTKALNGKEAILIPILFILFALGGTLFGMQEETLGLIPAIVPVLVLAGFDAVTGMLVVVLGTTTGISASVLDPFSVGVMAEGIGTTIGTGIIERLIMFLIYASMGATFVTIYGMRVKRNPEKSVDYEAYEANKVWALESIGDIEGAEALDKKQRGALIVFGVSFAWMVFSLMPWTTWFDLGKGWTIFSSIFFAQCAIGEWYFMQLAIMFMVSAIIIKSIFKMSNKDLLGTFWKSLNEMFGVITIIAMSRATSMILGGSGLTYTMVYGMVGDGSVNPTVFALTWLPIFLIMAFFIPSTSGLAGITAPIIGGVISAQGGADANPALAIGILMVYPLAQGVVNMFSPTTGLVVVQAESSNVNFGKVMPVLMGWAATILVVGAIMISITVSIIS